MLVVLCAFDGCRYWELKEVWRLMGVHQELSTVKRMKETLRVCEIVVTGILIYSSNSFLGA